MILTHASQQDDDAMAGKATGDPVWSAQEALLAAATQQPRDGSAANPRAWLISVTSRRLTDLLRGEQARQRRESVVVQRIRLGGWADRLLAGGLWRRGGPRR